MLTFSYNEVQTALANPSILRPYIANKDSSIGVDPSFGEFQGSGWAGQQSNDNQRVGTKEFQDSVRVDLGVGNSFMRVNGTSNSNHGVFGIMIDPAPPGFDSYKKYWAFTRWQVLQTTLFAIGLDPDKQ